MEDIDKNEVSDNGISEDEDLIKREVIQGDADLFYLHHYLSEVFRRNDKPIQSGTAREKRGTRQREKLRRKRRSTTENHNPTEN